MIDRLAWALLDRNYDPASRCVAEPVRREAPDIDCEGWENMLALNPRQVVALAGGMYGRA